ncbi:MAG: hypothetical protein QOJ68_1007, partial [Blastococcus sp.]|nr:hypothetical protein [Blastococcus sp.]
MSDTATQQFPGGTDPAHGEAVGQGSTRAPAHYVLRYDATRVRLERIALYASTVIAVAVPAVAAVDVRFPGRAVLALLFVLVVPGVPLASLLRVRDSLLASSLAGGISLACALLTSTAALTSGLWSPLGWAVGLAVAHVVATVAAHIRLRAVVPSRARPRPRRTGFPWVRVISLATLVVAIALWGLAVHWLRLGAAGVTGVIGVVSWPYVVAALLVAAVAAVNLLRRKLDTLVLTATAVAVTLVIFAFVNVASGAASVSTGWLHVGFIRYISVHQTTFSGLDARADWPGFFAAGAQLVDLAGVRDASAFLRLAPFVYNVAALAPLLVITRCVTRSQRLAWLALFV